MSSDRIVYVCECDRCHKPMGGVTQEELNHIASSMGDGLCFDCDPDSAATTPSIFWQWQKEDVFVIDDQKFFVTFDEKNIEPFGLARAHDASASARLSSYTYLNRNPRNSALLGSGEEVGVCVKCAGKGYYDARGDEWTCNVCDGAGTVTTAILLPSWVLGLGCENV